MNTTPTPRNLPLPRNLDAQLREDALARHALLDTQPYPVATYPPRPPRNDARSGNDLVSTGGWARLAGTLGLAGLAAAGIGLAAALLVDVQPADEGRVVVDAGRSDDGVMHHEASVAEGWRTLDHIVAQGTRPSVQAWSVLGQAPRLEGVFEGAGSALEQPIRDEFAALNEDLRTTADFLRQQWGGTPGTPGIPGIPGSSGSHDHRG